MKLAQLPAQRGYAAFKRLRDVTTFVEIIAQRERRILNEIYSGNLDPFTLRDNYKQRRASTADPHRPGYPYCEW